MPLAGDIFNFATGTSPPLRRIYGTRSAGGNSVAVIGSVLPNHISVGLNVNELELHGLPRRQRHIQKPIGIVGGQHGTYRSLESRAPVT